MPPSRRKSIPATIERLLTPQLRSGESTTPPLKQFSRTGSPLRSPTGFGRLWAFWKRRPCALPSSTTRMPGRSSMLEFPRMEFGNSSTSASCSTSWIDWPMPSTSICRRRRATPASVFSPGASGTGSRSCPANAHIRATLQYRSAAVQQTLHEAPFLPDAEPVVEKPDLALDKLIF